MSGERILLVEDDRIIRDAVVYALERERFDVRAVEGAREALAAARADQPDLVVLDVMLPDGSGMDVCRELRAESDVPIVMLTARSTELDRVLGLEVGADDYVVKPFSLAELIGRIRAHLRRRTLDRVGPVTSIVVGDLRIDFVRHEVTLDGSSLALTPAELRLLSRLAAEPERVFGRKELMETLWGSSAGTSRASDTHILNLRRKLQGSAVSIETVRGFGYRLRTDSAVSANPD